MKTLLILLIALSTSVTAQTTKTVSETIEPEKNEGSDKADELITNRRFRASNGSLSALSLNLAMSYLGGNLQTPLSADRPNLNSAGDTASLSAISGTINGSYRLTKVDRIGFGAGLQMLAPLQDDINTDDARAKKEFDENQGDLDVFNPMISYTRMAKIMGVQTISTTIATGYTAGNLTDAGYDYALETNLNTMYDFGGSPFSVGALLVYRRNFFDDDDSSLASDQLEQVFGFLPQAEYVINDTFNLRTIIRSNWYDQNRANTSKIRTRNITQSVGLGISVSRDVFLYPNIQFVNEDFTAENTNVGFTANINMF